MIFVSPVPTDTAAIYSGQYFSGGEQGFGYAHYDEDFGVGNPTFTTYLKIINRFTPGKGHLLDVGAATGTFLLTAKNHGWDVAGIEISAAAATSAREKGLSVTTGTIEDQPPESKKYDVITMWDVLEHVRHPETTVQAISRSLKPGGLFVLNLPDAGSFTAKLFSKWWPLIVPPEHLHLFSRKSLTTLLERHGFSIIETKHLGKKFRLAYILQVMYTMRYQKIWARLAAWVRTTPLDRVAIPLNLRDNLFVVAKYQPRSDIYKSAP